MGDEEKELLAAESEGAEALSVVSEGELGDEEGQQRTAGRRELVPREEVEALEQQVEELRHQEEELSRLRAELEEERRTLAEERQLVADALAFKQALEQDPKLAERVRKAVLQQYGSEEGEEAASDAWEPSGGATSLDPQLAQALMLLAQHGQLTASQLEELKASLEEQRKAAEELREFRRQAEMQRLEQEVREEVRRLVDKYPDRYGFAEPEEVVQAFLTAPEQARKAGVARLLRASSEHYRSVVERHTGNLRQQERKPNVLPVGGQSTVPVASKPVVTGPDRTAAMVAFLDQVASS